MWLEAARLAVNPRAASALLAQAVTAWPTSVRLWSAAAAQEPGGNAAKRRVLRRALELVPGSVALWRDAVRLEDDESAAAIMLQRAVECAPHATDLWLALARLQRHAATSLGHSVS